MNMKTFKMLAVYKMLKFFGNQVNVGFMLKTIYNGFGVFNVFVHYRMLFSDLR